MAGFVTFRRSERLKLSGIRPLPLNCGHSEDFCWPQEMKANIDANRKGGERERSTQHASPVAKKRAKI